MQSRPDNPRREIDELVPQVYDELRRIAEHYFRKQPPGFTLRPTDMVNEACLHLMQHSRTEWQGLEHFRAIATKKIWQVVVDHLKRRSAGKRGGPGRLPRDPAPGDDSDAPRQLAKSWQRIPLEAISVEWRAGDVALIDLAEALEELGQESRRLRDVVTLHWFGGLTYPEVADYLGVSASTVEKDFRYALAWLNRRLDGKPPDGD